MSAQNASTSATAARAAAGDSVLPRATNAIVTWISEYYGRAIAEMRAGGQLIQDEVLAHLWPTHHDNVNFFGTITVDIDGELAKLDTDGYRPLRHIPATASTVN